jgi:integrase
MSKTLTETPITTREQRKKLKARTQPYWRSIDRDIHLGYRKGKRGGAWLVRWRKGKGYKHEGFANADDEVREGTLDFNAAVKRAKEIVEAKRREERAAADGSALTVANAVEAYVVARDARDSRRQEREVRSDANSRLSRYVTGHRARGKRQAVEPTPLADISLHRLTENDLIDWRQSLPETLKSTTKRRLFNDLKAALNRAYTENRSKLPSTLPATIKHALRATELEEETIDAAVRDDQILTDAQVANLIAKARQVDDQREDDGDLYRLIVVLAATGARFSQAARLRVGDLQVKERRLFMPKSRKGRGGKIGHTPIPIGPDVLEVLIPVAKGRSKDAILLERWRKERVPGGIQWRRAERGPWRAAAEMQRAWDAIRDRAKLPHVVAYALRYSSIVRGISANLPIRLVAALHDTSVAMIERHYGRYIADGLDELAARSVVPLVPHADGENVVRLAS